MGCHEKWQSKPEKGAEKGAGNGEHLVEFASAMGREKIPEGLNICKSFHSEQESLFG